jgi:hypothetical protein
MLYVYFIYILTILHLCYISVSLVNGGRREGKGREEMKEHWGGGRGNGTGGIQRMSREGRAREEDV